MTLKKRRFIFYIFVLLFIIAGLAAVFYSDGWRVNTENYSIKIQRTGAVYIQTDPKGISIKIGKNIFDDKSGLLQKGTLVSELLPGNYKVEIQKNNYLAFVKNIAVESGLVSEISKIVLIPRNIQKNPVSLSKTPNSFWVNSDGKIVFANNTNLYYQSQDSSPVKLRGDKFIAWSNDNNKIITQDSKSRTYYLYQLDNLSKALNITASLNNLQKITIKNIKFHPLDSNRLIIQDKNNFLYILDSDRLKLENIIKEPVLIWTIQSPNIYCIKQVINRESKTKSYVLTSFNLVSKTEDFRFELSSQSTNQIFSEISASADKIVLLTSAGNLYLFNQQNHDFKQIASSTENFAISPDSKKIAFWDKDGKLNVYFAENYQNGISKKAGDVISFNFYLKVDGTTIKNISWHKDSSHLFIEYIKNISINQQNQYESASLDFMEIDDREPINKYTLIENAPDFNYQSDSNRLYFVEKNNLYFLEI